MLKTKKTSTWGGSAHKRPKIEFYQGTNHYGKKLMQMALQYSALTLFAMFDFSLVQKVSPKNSR